MVLKIFSIYDTKAEAYLPPFFSPTSGVAVRNFEAAAHDQSHAFHIHASDFCLMELGEFDDSNGSIKMLTAPRSLGLAINYIKPGHPGHSDEPVTLEEVTV